MARAEGPERAREHLGTVALDVIALEDIELSIGIVNCSRAPPVGRERVQPDLSVELLRGILGEDPRTRPRDQAGSTPRVVSIVVSGAQPGQYGKNSPVFVRGGV